MNAELEAQEDELLALASIYSQEFRRTVSGLGGEIRVSLDLPRDFSVIVKAGDKHRDYVISFLPPLVLTFDLPLDYPSTSSPEYILSCKWLSHSQLSAVCKHLDEIWEDTVGNVVLFYWVQFLRDDLLDFLNIRPPLEILVNDQGQATPSPEGSEAGDSQGEAEGSVVETSEAAVSLDPRALSMLATDTDLLVHLLDYDERQRLRVFEGQAYDCGICFMSKLGSSQYRECGHIYCNECMSEYFTVQIRDGNVRGLTCPEPECSSTATPSQVKRLVGEELFTRYDRLLLQSTLDRMADVIYCARKACVAPVVLEPDTTAALCPSCRYAFCTICRKTYHGTSNCKLRANTLLTSGSDSAAESSNAGVPQTEAGLQGLWEDYASGSEERRMFLEKRYGKHILNTVLEESLSEGWKGQNSKECPSCRANIQKNGGCNKMACFTCATPPSSTTDPPLSSAAPQSSGTRVQQTRSNDPLSSSTATSSSTTSPSDTTASSVGITPSSTPSLIGASFPVSITDNPTSIATTKASSLTPQQPNATALPSNVTNPSTNTSSQSAWTTLATTGGSFNTTQYHFGNLSTPFPGISGTSPVPLVAPFSRRCSSNPPLCCLGLNNSCFRGCFCDVACIRLKDCCPDFRTTCVTGVQIGSATVSPVSNATNSTSTSFPVFSFPGNCAVKAPM